MLHSICQQIWKSQQWPKNWKRSVFILIPKKGSAKECSNSSTIVVISHASKVMLKILQARFQQYMNWELPDVQAGFRKGRGIRDQIANICWIIEKVKEVQKNICFIDYAEAFDCVDHNKLWKILREMGIPDYLTCVLRNLYLGTGQFPSRSPRPPTGVCGHKSERQPISCEWGDLPPLTCVLPRKPPTRSTFRLCPLSGSMQRSLESSGRNRQSPEMERTWKRVEINLRCVWVFKYISSLLQHLAFT